MAAASRTTVLLALLIGSPSTTHAALRCEWNECSRSLNSPIGPGCTTRDLRWERMHSTVKPSEKATGMIQRLARLGVGIRLSSTLEEVGSALTLRISIGCNGSPLLYNQSFEVVKDPRTGAAKCLRRLSQDRCDGLQHKGLLQFLTIERKLWISYLADSTMTASTFDEAPGNVHIRSRCSEHAELVRRYYGCLAEHQRQLRRVSIEKGIAVGIVVSGCGVLLVLMVVFKIWIN